MCSRNQLRRLSAWLTTTSLCLSTLAPAFAQPASPAGVDQAGNPGTDPPALAGRLASVTGSVSFHASGETQWNVATLNYPVTNGEAFWTEPQAGAVLEIADDRLVMDDSTEIDVTALDQNQIAVTEAQGAVFLQLNTLPAGQGISLTTPRGTVQISAVGRYEIVAGDTNDATTVTVVEGAAHVAGGSLSLDIGPQQTATIGGSDVFQGSVGAMQQDAFLQAQLNVRASRVAQAAPQRLRYMTGGTDLQEYGSFSQTSDYGQVWFPNDLASNWAPYRDGRWAYVQPWGWTWVDNARWGFAPFHYGRWIQVQNRWGWVPGDGQGEVGAAYPVYSPALGRLPALHSVLPLGSYRAVTRQLGSLSGRVSRIIPGTIVAPTTSDGSTHRMAFPGPSLIGDPHTSTRSPTSARSTTSISTAKRQRSSRPPLLSAGRPSARLRDHCRIASWRRHGQSWAAFRCVRQPLLLT